MEMWKQKESGQKTDSKLQYDYDKQAWVRDGKYIKCGHTSDCHCYGKLHAGETPASFNWIQ